MLTIFTWVHLHEIQRLKVQEIEFLLTDNVRENPSRVTGLPLVNRHVRHSLLGFHLRPSFPTFFIRSPSSPLRWISPTNLGGGQKRKSWIPARNRGDDRNRPVMPPAVSGYPVCEFDMLGSPDGSRIMNGPHLWLEKDSTRIKKSTFIYRRQQASRGSAFRTVQEKSLCACFLITGTSQKIKQW